MENSFLFDHPGLETGYFQLNYYYHTHTHIYYCCSNCQQNQLGRVTALCSACAFLNATAPYSFPLSSPFAEKEWPKEECFTTQLDSWLMLFITTTTTTTTTNMCTACGRYWIARNHTTPLPENYPLFSTTIFF